MTKDLRYPLKQRPFPQRTLVLAVPRRVGLWVGLLDFEVQVGLDLDLDFYFESGGLWFGLGLEVQLGIGLWFGLGLEVQRGIGLWFGLGLEVQRGIGLWFGLGLEVPDFGLDLDF